MNDTTLTAFHKQFCLSTHLPVINREWEVIHGKPQWLGLVINHLLGQLYLAVSRHNHFHALQAMEDARTKLDKALHGRDTNAVRIAFWETIFYRILPDILNASTADTFEIENVIEATGKLRITKDTGTRTTSHEWTRLEEDITDAQRRITEATDRKASPEEREYMRMLFYAVSAAKWAFQKNSRESLANAVRDTLNVMELHDPHFRPAHNIPQTFMAALLEKLGSIPVSQPHIAA